MRIIQQGDKQTLDILAKQMVVSKDLRPLLYCTQVKVEDGVLLLNQMTMELLLLSEEELPEFFVSDYAHNHWFSVPKDTCEKELVECVRKTLAVTEENKDLHKDLMYLIFTTTSCNARCPYCYEIGHHTNISMTQDVAEKTADFILERTKENQGICLVWMGGEPLLNTKVMDTICGRIAEAGRPYYSAIATNGYRITDQVIEKMTGLWKMKSVQITIDGLEEEYNAVKRYTDPAAKIESPFVREMGNIGKMLDAGIDVKIHPRINKSNGEDICTLIGLLYKKFGCRKNLTVKISGYYQRDHQRNFPYSEATEKIITQYQIETMKMCFKFGYTKPKLAKKMKISHCNPDRNRQINILPDGKLGWCDNVIDRDFLGTVESQKLDETLIRKYKTRMPDLPECSTCPHYPACIRLNCCLANLPWCTSEHRKIIDYDLESAMIYKYRKMLTKGKYERIISE